MTYLMVAPNGARKTKVDHPFLPVTSPELVQTALACWQAGAQGLHAQSSDRHRVLPHTSACSLIEADRWLAGSC